MHFLKKQDAINYFNRCNNTDLHLFQEDLNIKGKKQFYVVQKKDIFHKLKRDTLSHFYEFWSDKCKMIFGIDVDMKGHTDAKQVVTTIIQNVILGAKKYYDITYKVGQIIVLQNDPSIQVLENPLKDSFHIIFRGITFENHIVCKDFFTRLTTDYDMTHCDKAIYNLSCLRLCFNSKMGKEATLLPIQITIGKKHTLIPLKNISSDELRNFWYLTMLTHIDNHDPIIDKSNIKTPIAVLQPKLGDVNESNVSNINLKDILFQLPKTYFNDYDYWIKIGMILKKISNDEISYYDLWNEWSKQSSKYDAKGMPSKWKSFKITDKGVNVGTLINWCKNEGIVNIFKNIKKSTKEIVEEYVEKPIIISDKYLKLPTTIILEQAKLTSDIFLPHLGSKLLAVQSEKGTGKTFNLLGALFSKSCNMINKDTSILFISSRRTFGIKLLNDLKEFGFKLYSEITDPYICARRIICQIDSLMRLERDKYDIVIIDEAESLARYMTSSHFTRNPKANLIISTLEMRVLDSNNTYILDADLSDRCINYFSKVKQIDYRKDMQLIVNEFKPYSDYEIKYMSYSNWLNVIITDIQANKKLVIAMASNSKAKDLLTKINQDFPDKSVLLIHKETSDEEKLVKLLKVNEQWITYDIVIYTPSVCMGVSFDVPDYFDNIYAYGCSNSLGSQEFCQMLHRVRSPKNKVIIMAIDYYKQSDPDDNINYNIVEQMLCSDYYLTNYDLHNNIVSKKITKVISYKNNIDLGLDDGLSSNDLNITIDDSNNKSNESNEPNLMINQNRDRVLIYPYKEEPIYDLYVRNSWESIEDKLNFPSKLFGYTKHKAYKHLFVQNDPNANKEIIQDMKNIRTDREEEETTNTVQGILNAPDLTHEEYIDKVKQKDEYLDEKDIYSIKRYNIVKCYNLNKKLELKINFNNDPNASQFLSDSDSDSGSDNPDNDKSNDNLNDDSESKSESEANVTEANVDATPEIEDTSKPNSNPNTIKEFLDADIIEEFYDKTKMKWYRNLSTILKTDELTTQNKLEIMKSNSQYDSKLTSCYMDFTMKNKYIYHFYAIEIIKTLGFDINNLEIAIDHNELDGSLYGCMEWIEDNKFDISNKFELKIFNKKLTNIDKFNDKLKIANLIILSQYGIKIKGTKTDDSISYKLINESAWSKVMGVIPINITSKLDEQEKYNSFDSSHLDMFIEDNNDDN